MSKDANERISVVAGADSVGVTVELGEVQVSVRSPRRNGETNASEEQLRSGALRNARRALEAAIAELNAAELQT